MTERIRVLHMLGALQGGGIQNFLLGFLRHCDRERFDMHVCEMSSQHGPLADEARERGASLHLCSLSSSPLTFRRRLAELIKAGRYDVVHIHRSSSIQGLPLRIAGACGVPVRIAHFQNIRPAPHTLRTMLEPALKGLVLKHATGILGVSQAVLDSHFGSARDERFRVIPNAIDCARFATDGTREKVRASLGIGPLDIVVGHTGRFSLAKNHGTVIECASRLAATNPAIRFLLVGDGELRGRIEAAIASAGLTRYVILTGWRTDLPELYSAMDVFFFPSVWEGFALSLLEAQAAGLPIVASDIPSNLEALAPELHDYTANPLNVEALRMQLERMIADTDRGRFSPVVRCHASQFDIRIIARRIQDFYLSQLERS